MKLLIALSVSTCRRSLFLLSLSLSLSHSSNPNNQHQEFVVLYVNLRSDRESVCG